MRNTGVALITIGFLAGSYATVLHEWSVNWIYFLPALIVGFLGVALLRVSAHRSDRAEERVKQNIESLKQSLERIVGNMEKLNQEKTSVDVYDLHERIDDTFIEDLNIFVEARESIGHGYTLQDYADIMSNFAAAERYLNRVWSTSVDGYVDEAHEYLERAEAQFTNAYTKLQALTRE
ncbi:MAG TPA: hypothetical protein VKA68_05890 [bacterium]|nr:hypothetical protein [bacterium]